MSPRGTGLMVQHHVILSDVVWVQDTVFFAQIVNVGDIFADKAAVDGPINYCVGNVNVLWAKLTSHGLRQRTQGVFGTRKGGKTHAAAHAGSCAGEDDRSATALQHPAGGFASGQETGKTRHFPYFSVYTCGRVRDVEPDIRTNVENDHFDPRTTTHAQVSHAHPPSPTPRSSKPCKYGSEGPYQT